MLTRNLVNNAQQGRDHEEIQKVSHFESIVPENKVNLYVKWVSKFYFSNKKAPGEAVTCK